MTWLRRLPPGRRAGIGAGRGWSIFVTKFKESHAMYYEASSERIEQSAVLCTMQCGFTHSYRFPLPQAIFEAA